MAEAVASERVVIDARAPERYDGTTEPIDPRAGHIPGALNVPFAGNLDAAGRFLDPAALRARYAAVGADTTPAIVYCGSGVTACHDLLAIEHAGLPAARLYPGSWSQWSADPARPVATAASDASASSPAGHDPRRPHATRRTPPADLRWPLRPAPRATWTRSPVSATLRGSR